MWWMPLIVVGLLAVALIGWLIDSRFWESLQPLFMKARLKQVVTGGLILLVVALVIWTAIDLNNLPPLFARPAPPPVTPKLSPRVIEAAVADVRDSLREHGNFRELPRRLVYEYPLNQPKLPVEHTPFSLIGLQGGTLTITGPNEWDVLVTDLFVFEATDRDKRDLWTRLTPHTVIRDVRELLTILAVKGEPVEQWRPFKTSQEIVFSYRDPPGVTVIQTATGYPRPNREFVPEAWETTNKGEWLPWGRLPSQVPWTCVVHFTDKEGHNLVDESEPVGVVQSDGKEKTFNRLPYSPYHPSVLVIRSTDVPPGRWTLALRQSRAFRAQVTLRIPH
jgi:hypothetical protein